MRSFRSKFLGSAAGAPKLQWLLKDPNVLQALQYLARQTEGKVDGPGLRVQFNATDLAAIETGLTGNRPDYMTGTYTVLAADLKGISLKLRVIGTLCG